MIRLPRRLGRLPQLGAVLAGFLLLAGCGRPGAESAGAPVEGSRVIAFGVAAPITGALAALGAQSEHGAQMAVDEANAAGGVSVGGRRFQVRLIAEDDKADPREATLAAQRLVDAGVLGVVGHVNSGASIPASRIYSEAGIAQVSPGSTAVKFTQQGYATAHRLVANDDQQGDILARHIAQTLKARSVVLIDDRTAYGQGLADVVASGLATRGVVSVQREFTSDKVNDYAALLTRIASLHPDVLLFAGMDAAAASIARQKKQLGLRAEFVTTDGACTPHFMELAGDAGLGVSCVNTGGDFLTSGKGLDFSDRYRKRFHEPVLLQAFLAYDAMRVLLDALQRAGSADRHAILAALGQTHLDGVIGPIAFDEHGDLRNAQMSLYRFSKEGQTLLKTYP